MRALVAVCALLAVTTISCADQPDPGNLFIRCPDSRGAISVSDGQVTVAGIPIRVAADLTLPREPDEGMTFAIEVNGPDVPTGRSLAVQCVRVSRADENVRWDAVPRRVEEFYDGSNARVRATGRDGPHWRIDELVDVTVWLKVATGRHVLTLPKQPIHTAP
jgi:hypothetical protein